MRVQQQPTIFPTANYAIGRRRPIAAKVTFKTGHAVKVGIQAEQYIRDGAFCRSKAEQSVRDAVRIRLNLHDPIESIGDWQ